jgi:hypothetical protein
MVCRYVVGATVPAVYGFATVGLMTWIAPEAWYAQLPAFYSAAAALIHRSRHRSGLVGQTHLP